MEHGDPAAGGLAEGANQRRPRFHSGPPNSSARNASGTSGRGSTLPSAPGSRAAAGSSSRFHQPLRSVERSSPEPSGAHSTWQTDSSGPPATVRGSPRPPSGSTSATRTSVPSQGIAGCSQAIQAARRPSGEGLGSVTNQRSARSTRTREGSSAAEPSRGIETRSRRSSSGAVPWNASRMHQTRSPTRTGAA